MIGTSIRAKLLLALMIPLTIVAAFVSLETFFASRKISHDLSDKTLLAASLTILERVISTNGNLLANQTLQALTDNLGDQYFYHVSGPNGAFVTGYSGYPRPPKDFIIDPGLPTYFDSQHLGLPVRVVLITRDFSDRELSGLTTITTWQRVTQRQGLTLSLFARSLARLGVLIFAVAIIVWFAIRYGLHPLTNLQQAIDRRSPYDLTPIKRDMPVELSGIVSSMNELFDRVARSKANRERFIGDAAHQLRNPIAAIKTQAEAALEIQKQPDMVNGLTQILGVSNAATRLINKLLSSAKAYSMDRQSQQQVDLTLLLKEAVADAALSAFERDHEIALLLDRSDALRACSYQGNAVLLKEAISNLINNAIEHNEPKSQIDVGLIDQGNSFEIYIADSGQPLSASEFDRLIQPFTTETKHQTGTGLGLSISNDIAKSHGGYLTSRVVPLGKKISIHLF